MSLWEVLPCARGGVTSDGEREVAMKTTMFRYSSLALLLISLAGVMVSLVNAGCPPPAPPTPPANTGESLRVLTWNVRQLPEFYDDFGSDYDNAERARRQCRNILNRGDFDIIALAEQYLSSESLIACSTALVDKSSAQRRYSISISV